jgi:L-fucose isomerase-like protein
MYFPRGGATITGQCKAGRFIWARANYVGTQVFMHVGTGHGVELPQDEFERRRRRATTYEWPLMNVVLDGIGRDDLMAGHQSNHITVAYVDEAQLRDVTRAFVVQALTQNIAVFVAGEPIEWLAP